MKKSPEIDFLDLCRTLFRKTRSPQFDIKIDVNKTCYSNSIKKGETHSSLFF